MKVVTIGRSSVNDIVLKDGFASRVHCQIIKNDNGDFFIMDFDSKNGTFVNGKRISGKVSLSYTDVVKAGKSMLNWQAHFPMNAVKAAKAQEFNTNSERNKEYEVNYGNNYDYKRERECEYDEVYGNNVNYEPEYEGESNAPKMSQEEMIALCAKLEDYVRKQKRSRKAVLTLGFSVIGFGFFWKSVKDSAESHVPEHKEKYYVDGKQVEAGWYNPKTEGEKRFFWRIFYFISFFVLFMIPVTIFSLIRYIYFSIMVNHIKNKLIEAQII